MKRNAQLYRHYNTFGTLLYVGISMSVASRVGQHRRGSRWFTEISNITVDHFPTRAKALKAEAQAIKAEHPIYNRTHLIKRSSIKIPDLTLEYCWWGTAKAGAEQLKIPLHKLRPQLRAYRRLKQLKYRETVHPQPTLAQAMVALRKANA